MKPFLLIFSFVLAVLLSSCGGGQSKEGMAQALASFTATVTGSSAADTVAVGASGLATGTASISSPSRQKSRAAGPIPQNGLWWNPAESGRGYAIEVLGNQILMGAYLYETSGAATWYLATLTQQANGVYIGALNRYSGGQTLLGSYKAPTSVVAVANAALTFSSTSAGSLSIQMIDSGATRTIAIERFGFSSPPFAAPQGNFQGGMWFNPDESGRGYFIEAQGDQVIIGTFMYDSSGQPTWYTTWGTLQNGELVSGQLLSFSGGQSLNGSFKAATATTSPGSVGITLTSSTTAKLTLPDGKVLSISRAVLPSIDACLSVKQGFTGDIETTSASAGTTGGDGGGAGGGGGSGGGAGAGGGLGKVLGGLMRVVDLSDGTFIGEAVTDSILGLVTVKTCTRPGPFLLTLEGKTGAKYFDEGLNQLTDFGPGQTLHALVDKWDEHVGVSPLTEAAYRYALNNFKGSPADIAAGRAPLKATGNLIGITPAQVQTANNLIKEAINSRLTTNYQLSSAKALPTPIDASSSNSALSTSKYGVSAAVNGGFVKAANFYNPGITSPGLTLATDLGRDFTDGKIDGFTLDGTQVAPANVVSYESTRLPLGGKIGTDAVATKFGATTLLQSQKTINEESIVSVLGSDIQYSFPNNVLCEGFNDDVALMSDGGVTVRRHFATKSNGSCAMVYNAETTKSDLIIPNFLTDVKFLAAGGPVTYAVKTDGTVYGWGENFCERLSLSLPYGVYAQPQLIPNLKDITSISVDYVGVLARDKDGTIYTWGFSGNKTRASASAVSCGSARATDGTVFSQYADAAVTVIKNLPNVSDVFSYATNYFALTSDGRVYGWGEGYAGLLANSGGATNSLSAGTALQGSRITSPTVIPNLTNVRKLVFSGNTAFALLYDGTVKAWGSDSSYLLGNGKQLLTPLPTTVPGLSNISNIVGDLVSLRLEKYDGTVLVWGNKYGTLLPDKGTYYTPTVMLPAEKIRHIAARSAGYTVYFTSGKIGRDINQNYDLTLLYR